MVLVIEYMGTPYHGFQLQADVPTVQGEMEHALGRLTGESTRVMAASRTDAGVHAKGQVVGFRTKSTLSPQTFVKGLNYYLPQSIAVKAAYRMSDDFNVRRRALSREYRYYILNSPTPSPLKRGLACFSPRQLDIEAMAQACSFLVGEHDFASFTTAANGRAGSTRRRVYQASIDKKGEFMVFHIVANSFMLHQVRNTVGALLKTGMGSIGSEEFQRMVEAKIPGLAGPTAPACGLYLMKVNYAQPLDSESYDDLQH
ncbi:tRNA pseudouridine(38-40) synthase TruA [Chloroflexota bacterium]